MMPEIRLQFATEAGIGPALIRWFTGGGARAVSHVDTVLPDGRLYGARSDHAGGLPRGVWARPPGYARFRRRIVAVVPVLPVQRADYFAWLQRQKGLPYDWLAIAAFLVNRDWRDTRSWFCSELVARGFEVAGILPPGCFLAANKVTPVMLAQTVSLLPGVRLEDPPSG